MITTLGEGHPRCLEMIAAVRIRHLRLLIETIRPGGRAVLITDFVSSVTCPGLAEVDEAELGEFAARLVRDRNFFTGLNPWVLQTLFTRDPWLAANVAGVRMTPPWLWHFPTRLYAVCAFEAIKAD